MSEKTIVVTGASTGIGYAIAERFAKNGWKVFGSVRKPEDGERLRSELGVTPLQFDVTDREATAIAVQEVSAALGNGTLGGLVNNAGLSLAGPLLYMPMEILRKQMEVNFMAVVQLQQMFAPLLGADRSRKGTPGRIAQISSVAGSTGFPFLGAYSASKYALEGMSESLRRELMLFGIEVSIIVPGAVVTPIWGKGHLSAPEQYAATPYGPALQRFAGLMQDAGQKGLPASRVADAVWHAMTAKKPKLRYQVIPRKFREYTLPRLLPKRAVDRFLGKIMGLTGGRG